MRDPAQYSLRLLTQDCWSALYRGTDPAGATMLLARPASGLADSLSCARFDNELAMTRGMSIRYAAPAVTVAALAGRPALMLADPGGEPLDGLLGVPFAMERFLAAATALAGALAEIHALGIVHNAIRPSAVLLDGQSGVRLTGFGAAFRHDGRGRADGPHAMLALAPPYMAPEQTGRMDHALDARTDLYSAGVTLYQMLTASLPFAAKDLMEWVHAHVARQPTPPGRWVRGIPSAVAGILATLLAKNPQQRYQTAKGLRDDLAECLARWETSQQVEPLPLRRTDVRDHLVIPDRLYGRQGETAALVAALDRVGTSGGVEFALISGMSGVGKSALVADFLALAGRSGARIAAGKCDPLSGEAPFAVILEAFRRAMRDLLEQGEAAREALAASIAGALGPNAGVMAALIPELSDLLGPRPPVPPLPSREAQARFQHALERFLAAFAVAPSPVVLFLDDLQWVDPATAALIARLVVQAPMPRLLLIGAYRSNEVGNSLPLMDALEQIKAAGHAVAEIALAPLGAADISHLTADALGCPQADVAGLSRHIAARSAGNPLFAIQLLTSLAARDVVAFDSAQGAWRWKAEEVGALELIGLADLMVARLHRLPIAVQRDLGRLACLGSTAPADLLSVVLDCGPGDLRARLAGAIEAGLVECGDRSLSFAHDQVQDAALSLIDPDERPAIHLAIGRAIRAAQAVGTLADATFVAASQMNRGLGLIDDPDERCAVARLNLEAATKATGTAGHAAALNYLAAGISALGERRGAGADHLRFALDLASAEALFLHGAADDAETLLADLATDRRPPADAASIAWLRITIATAKGDLDRAVDLCLGHLAHFGIRWSAHPTMAEVEAEFAPIRSEIAAATVERRLALPRLTRADALANIEVLTAVLPPAFFTDQRLVCLVLCRMANLSATHGNSAASALGYAYLGMVLGPVFGDYAAGYRFGKLGIDLVEWPGFDRFRGRVVMTFAYHVLPYSRPLAAGREPLRRAFQLSRESGDLTYAGYSTCTLISNLLASGEPLASVERQADEGLAFVRQAKFGLIEDIVTTQLMLIRALRGLTEGPATFADGLFDEAAFEARLAADPALRIAECWNAIRKIEAHVYAGDYGGAVAAAARAKPLLWTTEGHLELVEYHFYAAIALAASAGDGPATDRAALIGHREPFLTWAQNAPTNFRHHLRLLDAEIARLDGDTVAALRAYDEAARSAQDNGFSHIEGLAFERAAAFADGLGLAATAEAHRAASRAAYRRWGAEAPLRRLSAAPAAAVQPRGGDEPMPSLTSIDVAAIVRSSEALASEPSIAGLARALMTILMENSGAQRGVLFLLEEAQPWRVAEATTDAEGIRVVVQRAAARSTDAPLRILAEAIRTRSAILLGDAGDPEFFGDDPYLAEHAPRSVLALPIVRRGKTANVIYLEHFASSRVFTPARLAMIRLMATQAAISLENARLEEKEALLREVHHRVKNNLQLITSLLNLQAARVADPAIAELFAESRNRVRAMALVHENLYRAESFALVAMDEHLRELCAHLRRAYAASQRRVAVTVEAEGMTLDLDRALSCGLIVNELVSNALKHAFSDGQEGVIAVTMTTDAFDRCTLTVADDGNGLLASRPPAGTLGLQLVADLCDQLCGELLISGEGGTTVSVVFDASRTDCR